MTKKHTGKSTATHGRGGPQPRPKGAMPWPEPTPFAHLLTEYAWSQRTPQHPRPLSATEIGARCGYGRQTVGNWIRGVEPPIYTMLDTCARLGIPVNRLVEVYSQAQSFTAAIDTAPGAPLPIPPPLPTRISQQSTAIDEGANDVEDAREAEWQASLRDTEASMREAGMTETDVHRVIVRMKQRRAGTEQLARYVTAEFEETRPLPAQQSADEQTSAGPAHTK